MTDYEKIIRELDRAGVFLRNRAEAEPAPLNEYDIEALYDIAKICDEAARIIEDLTPPMLTMNLTCNMTQEEFMEALQKSHAQIIPSTQKEII